MSHEKPYENLPTTHEAVQALERETERLRGELADLKSRTCETCARYGCSEEIAVSFTFTVIGYLRVTSCSQYMPKADKNDK